MTRFVDLLNAYVFSEIPGPAAMEALQAAWTQVNSSDWEELYLQALRTAIEEATPRLSIYSPKADITPDRITLVNVLNSDLGPYASTRISLESTPEEFAAALSSALAQEMLPLVREQNLTPDDYAEVIHSLLTEVEGAFKQGVEGNTPSFRIALLTQTSGDDALVRQIEAYLTRRFGLEVESPDISSPSITPPAPPEPEQGHPTERFSLPHGELRIVVSAPEDVRQEQELVVRTLEEIRETTEERLGISLRLLQSPSATRGRESRISPGMWDAFVGIVWLRFGEAVNPRDPDPRHANASGTREEFEAAFSGAQSSGAQWPKCLVYRRTQPPVDLLAFDIDQYVKVQQFFAVHNAISNPKASVQHYSQPAEIGPFFQEQLTDWITEFAETQAAELTDKGLASEEEERWGDAVSFYEQASDLFRRLGRADSVVTTAAYFARAQRGAKQQRSGEAEARGDQARINQSWKESESAYQSSLELARELGDRERLGRLFRKLGQLSAERKSWSEALSWFGQAREFFDAPEQTEELRSLMAEQAMALERLGSLQHVEKNWEKATDYYRQALALTSERRDRIKQAALLYQLGLIAEEQEQWTAAFEQYDQALRLLKAPEQLDHRMSVLRHQAIVIEKVGDIAQRDQRWQQAEAYYNDGLEMARVLLDQVREAELLARLGEVAEAQGQWEEGLDYDRRALAGFEQAGKGERTATIKKRLAVALENVGDLDQEQQAWGSAQTNYHESLSLARELGNRLGEAELLYKLGVSAEGQGQWAESLDSFNQALLLFDEMNLPDRQSDILRHQLYVMERLGDSARSQDDPDQAFTSYHQALAWAQHLGDSAAQAQLQWKLGLVSADQQHWMQAIGYYEQALGQLKDDETVAARKVIIADQAIALEKLGDTASADQNWKRAETTYRQALQFAREGNDRHAQALLLNKLGETAERQESWHDSVEHYSEALEIARDLDLGEFESAVSQSLQRAGRGVKHITAAEALTRGDTARGEKKWEPAESAYLEALGLAEELGDRTREAETLHKLGMLSEERAQWVDALTYYRKALPILTEQGARETQVKVLWNIGRAQRGAQRAAAIEAVEQGDDARSKERWGEAESAYSRGLALAKQSGNVALEGEISYRLGLLAADRENWEDALDYYAQALTRLDEDKQADRRQAIQRDQSVAMTRIGDQARAAGDWDKAESSYRSSLAVAQALGDNPEQGSLSNRLGLLASAQSKWEEAIDHFDDAIVHFAAPEFAQPRLEAIRSKAVAFEQIGDAALSAQDWSSAGSAYQESAGLCRELGDGLAEAQLLNKLGLLAEDQGQWDPALGYYERALGRFTDLGLVEAQAVIRDNADRVKRSKKHDEAFEAMQKGDAAAEVKQWEAAQARYRHALDLFSELALPDEQAAATARIVKAQRASIQELAEQSAEQGDKALGDREWDVAVSHFQRAGDRYSELALPDEVDNMNGRIIQAQRAKTQDQAESAAGKGYAEMNAGQWEAAQQHFRQALELYADLALPDEQADMTSRIVQAQRAQVREQAELAAGEGDAALGAKEWIAAQEHYRKAFDLFSDLALPDEQANMSARIDQAQRGKKQEEAEAAAAAGDGAFASGKWDEAVPHFEIARDLFSGLALPAREAEMAARIEESFRSKSQEEGRSAKSKGDAAFDAKQWDTAQEHYRQASTLFAQAGLVDEAAESSERTELAEREKMQEQADVALADAGASFDAKRWDDAIEHFQRALDLFTTLDIPELQARATEGILQTQRGQLRDQAEQAIGKGDAAVKAKHWDEAVPHYQQALDLYSQLALPDEQATISARITQTRRAKIQEQAELSAADGDAAFEGKRWDEAIPAYQQALDLYSGLALPDEQARMSARITQTRRAKIQEQAELARTNGDAAFEAKGWDEAIAHYQQALDLYFGLALPDDQARLADRITLTQRSKIQEQAERATANGDAALEGKQWDEAVPHYQQALDLYSELALPDEQARITDRITLTQRSKIQEQAEQAAANGDAALAAKQWDEAVPHYRQALELYSELALPDEQARITDRITQTQRSKIQEQAERATANGDAVFEAGQWDDAIPHYQHALDLYSELALPDEQARLAERISQTQRSKIQEQAEQATANGDAVFEAGQWDEAIPHYQHALDLYSGLDLADKQARLAERISQTQRAKLNEQAGQFAAEGDAAFEAKHWDEAIPDYQRALDLYSELALPDEQSIISARITQAERAKIQEQAELALANGDTALEAKQWDEAIPHYQQALDLYSALALPEEQATSSARIIHTQRAKIQEQAELAVANGDAALEAKHWDEAIPHYQQAVALYSSLGLSEEESRFAERVTSTQRAKLREGADRATADGDAAFDAGHWDDAQRDYGEALGLLAQLELPREQADISARITQAYRSKIEEAADQAVAKGDTAVQSKLWDDAIPFYEQALDLFLELALGERQDLVVQRISSAERGKVQEQALLATGKGDAALGAKQWEEAVSHYRNGLDLFAKLELSEHQANLAERIAFTQRAQVQDEAEKSAAAGDTALAAKDWDEAERSYRRAFELFKEIELTQAQANASYRITFTRRRRTEEQAASATAYGDAALKANLWDDAIPHYQRALDLYSELALPDEQARLSERIAQTQRAKILEQADQAAADGDAALEAKRWDDAIEHYRQALDLISELAPPEEEAHYLERIAFARRASHLQEAEQFTEQGRAAFDEARWDDARDNYEGARRVYAELSLPEAEAQVAESIDQVEAARRKEKRLFAEQSIAHGDAAFESRRWDEAAESYERALEVLGDLGSTDAQAVVTEQIAHTRHAQKQEEAELAAARGDEAFEAERWGEAESAYQDSLMIVRELGNQPGEANLLEVLGETAEAQEEWDRAKAYYGQANAVFSEIERPSSQMGVWRKLGGLHFSTENWTESFEAYQHSLAISRELGERGFEAQVLNDLGLLEEARGRWDEALDYYRPALDLFTELNIPEAQAVVAESIDTAQRAKKTEEAHGAAARADAALAEENWHVALEHYRKAHSLFAELEQPEKQAEILEQIKRAERSAQEQAVTQAVTRAEAARSGKQWDAAESAYQEAFGVLREIGEYERAGEILIALGSTAEDQRHFGAAEDYYRQAQELYAELQLEDARSRATAKLDYVRGEARRAAAASAADRGAAARAARDWTEAESAYGESLQLSVELGDHASSADALQALGDMAEEQRNWDKAADIHRRAHAIFEQAGDRVSQAAALEKVGDAQKNAQHWGEAEAAYRDALQIAAGLLDRHREGELLNKLGVLHAAQGRWDEAHANYRQALKVFEELELHSSQTNVWRNIAHAERGAKSMAASQAASAGDAKRAAKQWDKAEAAYRHSLALSQEVGDRTGEGWRWNDLGSLALEQEHWSEAQDAYRHALEIFQESKATESQALVWRNLARAKQGARDWNEAEDAYRRSMTFSQETGDRAGEGWVWNDLGRLAADQGRWESAQEDYQRALDIFQGDGSPEAIDQVWRNQLHAQSDQLRESLSAAQQQGGRGRQGQLLNDLGLIAEKLEQWKDALSYYDQALQVFEAMDLKNAQLTIWRNKGEVHRINRHWDEAVAAYQQAVVLAQALGFRSSEANSLGLIGLVAEGRGEWAEASTLHRSALAIFEELGDASNQAAAFEKVGDAERGSEHWDEAEAAYRQALALAQRLSETPREGHAWNKLGMLAAQQELWDEAIESYRRALLLFETADLPLNQAQVLMNIGHAQMGKHLWTEAAEAYEGGLSLYRELGDTTNAAWAVAEQAHLYQAQREWDKAIRSLKEAHDSFRTLEQPTNEAAVVNRMSKLRFETGNLPEAEGLAKSAMTMYQDPLDHDFQSETLDLLAAIAFERHDLNQALELLERATDLNPRNWAARVDLALAYLFSGEAAKTVRQCEACLGKGSRWDLSARLVLALGRHSIGDLEGMREELATTEGLLAEKGGKPQLHRVFHMAASSIIAALEGDGEGAISGLARLDAEPPVNEAREAYRFARRTLLWLSRSPRQFKGKPALTSFFKQKKSKRSRQRSRSRAINRPEQNPEPSSDDSPAT